MHLQLIERGVRHIVEAGGRWAVMLGRLLGMLGREERIHMIERGLRQVVVGDALGYVGMLVGVFGAWQYLGHQPLPQLCGRHKQSQWYLRRCLTRWGQVLSKL